MRWRRNERPQVDNFPSHSEEIVPEIWYGRATMFQTQKTSSFVILTYVYNRGGGEYETDMKWGIDFSSQNLTALEQSAERSRRR